MKCTAIKDERSSHRLFDSSTRKKRRKSLMVIISDIKSNWWWLWWIIGDGEGVCGGGRNYFGWCSEYVFFFSEICKEKNSLTKALKTHEFF